MEHRSPRNGASEYHREALHSYGEDRHEDALVLLSFAFEKDPEFRPAYETAVEILETIGWDDEADLFRGVIETFHDAARSTDSAITSSIRETPASRSPSSSAPFGSIRIRRRPSPPWPSASDRWDV